MDLNSSVAFASWMGLYLCVWRKYLLEPRDPLATELLWIIIITIWPCASEDVSVKARSLNGPLFISKPHCCSNLSTTFCMMGTGSTTKSSSKNSPSQFISPCAIAIFNAARAQPFPFITDIWWALRTSPRPDPVMVPSSRTKMKRGRNGIQVVGRVQSLGWQLVIVNELS